MRHVLHIFYVKLLLPTGAMHMKVIPFPQKRAITQTQKHADDYLMNATERALNHIVADIGEFYQDGESLREGLIYVLDKLSDVAKDLKHASNNLKSC